MTEPSSIAVPAVGPGQILPYASSRFPDKIALVNAGESLTYRQLNRMSDSIAAALHVRGIGAGAVCSLYGQNNWQWIVAYHGILKAGAVVNPINVMLTGAELAFVLADCNSRVVFAGAAQAATVHDIRTEIPDVEMVYRFDDAKTNAPVPEDGSVSFAELLAVPADAAPAAVPGPAPRDLCSIAYTSGTTGHPKGAMQSHESVLLNTALTATMHGRSADDIVVTALPAAHVYGNVAINATFLAGGTVVLMDRFDAARALALIAFEHATMFEGVPTMYSMMTGHHDFGTSDLSSLRVSTIGGQTFSPELLRRWSAHAPGPVLELWGMTEISGLGTTHALHAPPVIGSIGVSLPGMDLRISSLENGAEVPPGEHGELTVRGPLVMIGYHGRPDATAEVLSPDGWLRTGDVAYRDNTGHVFIVDRLKDMIITGGYNVYPAEIERVVGSHPDVAMVAVGGLPDEVKGEIAVAYVVPVDGVDLNPDGVIEFCKEHLAAYKRPREVVVVRSLPTTSSGKLMRRKLSEIHPGQTILATVPST